MKDTLAKELLYFFFAIITAIPAAFLFMYMLQLDPDGVGLTGEEKVLEVDLMLIGAALGFLGVYLIRLTIWAVSQLFQ